MNRDLGGRAIDPIWLGGALLAALQKRGVPASDLQKVAPTVLQPGATDVLAALGA